MTTFRERIADERGMTLVEMMTSVALLLVVLGTFLTMLESVNRGVGLQVERSEINDRARLAIERLDREIRSGNVMYNPATEPLAGYTFRVYTQSNAPTRTPPNQCVEWRINDSAELVRRTWDPADSATASDWIVVADHVVNRSLSPPVTAFALDPDPAKAGRTLHITLMVDVDLTDQTQKTQRIQTALTGRNTSFGFSVDACSPVPAG
jgi:prepilin-type N-terminal cleavage/methylation domain-containing protein